MNEKLRVEHKVNKNKYSHDLKGENKMKSKIKSRFLKTLAVLMSLLICVLALPVYAASNEFVEPPPKSLSSIASIFTTIGDTTVLTGEYKNVAMVTYDAPNQIGALWAADKLDLTLPFRTEMMIHLGHAKGGQGKLADGMTFTLHNDRRGYSALGGRGEGLGAYKGRVVGKNDVTDGQRIENSLVIEFDTHYNIYITDPGFYISDPKEAGRNDANQRAHCSVMTPKKDILRDEDHRNTFFFDATQNWEKFTVSWEPYMSNGKQGGNLIYTFLDDTKRVFPIEDVISVFGNTKVYWGFTGSTGSLTSYQAAAITKLPTQEIQAKKDVLNSSRVSIDGENAEVGDVLTYAIDVEAMDTLDNIGSVSISDTLSPYVRYAGDGIRVKTSRAPTVTKTILPTISGEDMIMDTGEILKNAGDSLRIEFEVDVLEGAVGAVIENEAVVSAENLTEPQKTNLTQVNVNKQSYKIVDCRSREGTRGKPVKPGDEMTFRIGYVNNGTEVSNLTITDVLDKGLTYMSSSEPSSYNAITREVKWEISDIKPNEFGSVTITAKVNGAAGETIKNKANLLWEKNPLEEPEIELPVKGSFKTVDGSSEAGFEGDPITIGDIVTFKIGYLNPTGSIASLSIKDVIPDSLEYVEDSVTNGGAYTLADKTITWAFSNVPKDGSGTVTFKAKVIRVDVPIIKNTANMNWSFGIGETEAEDPYVELPVGSYKIVDNSSLAGINGEPVIPGDSITYRISYLNSTDDTADLTITDKLPVGVDLVSYTGTLNKPYDPNGARELEWIFTGIAENASGSLYVTVKVNENIGHEVVNMAELKWSNGDIEKPEVIVPVKSYKKVTDDSAAGANLVAVVPGDVITYKIAYVNNKNVPRSLIITDNLDKALTYVSSDPTLSALSLPLEGKLVWEFSVPANSSGSIRLMVRVNEKIDKTVKNKTVLNWGDETEEPETENPAGIYKIVDESSLSGTNGKKVKPGDEITFKIGYWNNSDKYRNLVITDKLEKGLDYIASYYSDMKTHGTYDVNTKEVSWRIGLVAPNESGYVYLKVKVNEYAEAVIKNIAKLEWDSGTPEEPEIVIPVESFKVVSDSSEAGKNGTAVNVGDTVTCKIGFVNNTGDIANLIITDILPQEVEYISHSIGNVPETKITIQYTPPNEIEWSITDISDKETGFVLVTFKVKESAGAIIKNLAILEWSTDPTPEIPEVEIPVKSKKYIASGPGVNGTVVKLGDTVEYTINYINQMGAIADLTIKDVLPEGTSYVSHEKGATLQSGYDATRRIVTWEFKDLAAEANGTVTLKVKIEKAVSGTIVNVADMEWTVGDTKEIEKPSVEVPLGNFTIEYNPNGGEGGRTLTNFYYGANHTVYTQLESNITRNGYTFVEWKTEKDAGTAYRPGENLKVNDNIVLYAQWKSNDPGGGGGGNNYYKVTYNANDGVGSHEDRNIAENTAYKVKGIKETNISRAGFVFVEWNTSKDGKGTSYKKDDVINVHSDINLYAIWEPATSLDTDNHFAYVIGYSDKKIHPDDNITRAEVATIFFRLLKLEDRKTMWEQNNSYSDVNLSAWHNNSISTLSNGDIIKGYKEGDFRPNRNITRAEFAVIAVRFANDNSSTRAAINFKDISGHWAEADIKKATELGYIEGYSDGTFRPDRPIIRAEVTTLLDRVLNRHVESENDMLSSMVKWPDNTQNKWYYYEVQEASNSHFYDRKEDGKNEVWTELRPVPKWTDLEKPDSKPEDVVY